MSKKVVAPPRGVLTKQRKVELGSYLCPDQIGFVGWIKNLQTGEVIFIDLEGNMCNRKGQKIPCFSESKRGSLYRVPFNPSFRKQVKEENHVKERRERS